jgi:hypothetical protein
MAGQLRALAVVVVSTVLMAWPAPIASRQAPRDVGALLDAYARGEFDSAVGAAAAAGDPALLVDAIQRAAPEWARSGGRSSGRTRRLAAAAFALEVAGARMRDDWRVVRPLVEWGCQLLRKGDDPSEGERRWHLAALALAQGAMDDALLFRAPGQTERDPGRESFEHLSHSESRFPAERRFALARRYAILVQRPDGFTLDAGFEPARDVPPQGPPLDHNAAVRAQTREFRRRSAMNDAIRGLGSLVAHSDVGPEAALRAGYLAMLIAEPARALASFQTAAVSDDEFVAYLAHFLTGRLHERADRLTEAEAAYRRALDVMPGTQSASVALSALLIRRGIPAEGQSLLRASFDALSRPPDPWRLFGYGDYRRWPALVEALRAAVRP